VLYADPVKRGKVARHWWSGGELSAGLRHPLITGKTSRSGSLARVVLVLHARTTCTTHGRLLIDTPSSFVRPTCALTQSRKSFDVLSLLFESMVYMPVVSPSSPHSCSGPRFPRSTFLASSLLGLLNYDEVFSRCGFFCQCLHQRLQSQHIY
jgi:hypothetical protein